MNENNLGFDQFGDHCGIELKEQSQGRAAAEADIKPHHLNGLGVIHGGFIFTMADIAFAAASNYNDKAIGISVNVSYLKGEKAKRLRAEASCISSGRKISHYNIDVTSETGTLVAKLTAIAYNLTK